MLFDLRTKHDGNGKGLYSVLCLGAHADDIEIGCGGTILRLIQMFGRRVAFHWVVFSASAARKREAAAGADRFLSQAYKKTISVKNFRDSVFPYSGRRIKTCFEQLKKTCSPDLVFTHYRNDLHQDHRMISELTWNTFRDHLILEYEIPKYDGDLGAPNFFRTDRPAHLQKKNSHYRRLLRHSARQTMVLRRHIPVVDAASWNRIQRA